MSWSLGEVEAMARKAARGAGYSWGLSDEAGMATRWLCANSVDGCGVLLRLLEQVDRTDLKTMTPVIREGVWAGAQGRLCPLNTGAALSDRAADFGAALPVLRHVVEPLLLAPFIARLAQVSGQTLQLSWQNGSAITDGKRLSVHGAPGPSLADVQIGIAVKSELDTVVAVRADPDPDVWIMLNRFAHRTYAPATEASREKGAGAGVSDND